MAPRIDWKKHRRVSRDIPDFVKNMTQVVRRLPSAERAVAYQEILSDIDPYLENLIREEVATLTARGEDPARSLELATVAHLTGRRKYLFRWLFNKHLPRLSEKIMDHLMRDTAGPKSRAEKFGAMVERLLPEMRHGYTREEAAFRLREGGLSPEQVEWAVTREPLRSEDVPKMVQARISSGMRPVEAMQEVLEIALKHFALDELMSFGVASGPDFCIAVSIVVGAAGTIAGIAMGAISRRDQRQAREEAEAEFQRQQEIMLPDHELREWALAAASKTSQREEAVGVLQDAVRTQRSGRDYVLNAERDKFLRYWGEARLSVQKMAEEDYLAEQQRQRSTHYVKLGLLVAAPVIIGAGLWLATK
jgi:hypothetical protein